MGRFTRGKKLAPAIPSTPKFPEIDPHVVPLTTERLQAVRKSLETIRDRFDYFPKAPWMQDIDIRDFDPFRPCPKHFMGRDQRLTAAAVIGSYGVVWMQSHPYRDVADLHVVGVPLENPEPDTYAPLALYWRGPLALPQDGLPGKATDSLQRVGERAFAMRADIPPVLEMMAVQLEARVPTDMEKEVAVRSWGDLALSRMHVEEGILHAA